jgi:hypothetical protein
MKPRKIGFWVFVSVINLGVLPAFGAGGSKDFITTRSYIGALGVYTNITDTGDINGRNFFQAAAFDETDVIPSIDRAFGFGFLLGHREGAYAAEVSYWRTSHTGTFMGGTTPAIYHSINVDFKRYLFTQYRVQPFLSLGISFPWLVYDGASFSKDSNGNTVSSDLSLSGVGVNLGLGAEAYVTRDFSIVVGMVQRWAGFDQLNGYYKESLQPQNANGNAISLEGDGLNFYFGGTLGFE